MESNQQAPTKDEALSYADVVQYIIENKPVPGIKQIDDEQLGIGAASHPDTSPRKKPWQK